MEKHCFKKRRLLTSANGSVKKFRRGNFLYVLTRQGICSRQICCLFSGEIFQHQFGKSATLDLITEYLQNCCIASNKAACLLFGLTAIIYASIAVKKREHAVTWKLSKIRRWVNTIHHIVHCYPWTNIWKTHMLTMAFFFSRFFKGYLNFLKTHFFFRL